MKIKIKVAKINLSFMFVLIINLLFFFYLWQNTPVYFVDLTQTSSTDYNSENTPRNLYY